MCKIDCFIVGIEIQHISIIRSIMRTLMLLLFVVGDLAQQQPQISPDIVLSPKSTITSPTPVYQNDMCDYRLSKDYPSGRQNSNEERKVRKHVRRLRQVDHLKCALSSPQISVLSTDDHPINEAYYGVPEESHDRHRQLCPLLDDLHPDNLGMLRIPNYTESDAFDTIVYTFMDIVYVPWVFPNTWHPNVELVVSYDDLIQYNKKYCYVPTFQDMIASIIGFVGSGSLVVYGIYVVWKLHRFVFGIRPLATEEKHLSMLINKYAHVAPTFNPSGIPIPFQPESR